MPSEASAASSRPASIRNAYALESMPSIVLGVPLDDSPLELSFAPCSPGLLVAVKSSVKPASLSLPSLINPRPLSVASESKLEDRARFPRRLIAERLGESPGGIAGWWFCEEKVTKSQQLQVHF